MKVCVKKELILHFICISEFLFVDYIIADLLRAESKCARSPTKTHHSTV